MDRVSILAPRVEQYGVQASLRSRDLVGHLGGDGHGSAAGRHRRGGWRQDLGDYRLFLLFRSHIHAPVEGVVGCPFYTRRESRTGGHEAITARAAEEDLRSGFLGRIRIVSRC